MESAFGVDHGYVEKGFGSALGGAAKKVGQALGVVRKPGAVTNVNRMGTTTSQKGTWLLNSKNTFKANDTGVKHGYKTYAAGTGGKQKMMDQLMPGHNLPDHAQPKYVPLNTRANRMGVPSNRPKR